jgi:cytochrome c553
MTIAKKSSGRVQTALLVFASGGIALASGCVRPAGSDESPPPGTVVTSGNPGSSDPGFLFDDAGSAGEGGGGFGCLPQAPVPAFGTPVACSTPPPPISGGTLIVSRDGTVAIAADPDRDAVYVVDLASATRKFTVPLQAGDEPGRLAEDGAGRIHVALRGSGTLATIDPTSGTVTVRRAACPAPRGVAWQASSDTVWVACATGELAALPAAGGAASITVVGRDLRDVLLNGDALAVTQFRSAQLLRLGADETVTRTDSMQSPSACSTEDGGAGPCAVSHVVWRAVPGPGGTVVAVHQSESTLSISTKSSGGYGCGGMGGLPLPPPPPPSGNSPGAPITGPPTLPGFGGPVTSVITVIDSDGTTSLTESFNGVLPVDVAISPDGSLIAAVAAGSGTGADAVDNIFLFGQQNATEFQNQLTIGTGAATALAFAPNGDLLVQTREPAALWVVPHLAGAADAGSTAPGGVDAGTPTSIPLSTISKEDTGHDIFHTHAGALIACASCHPEGGDDGHVWRLDGNLRRTPSLRGTIAGTAPYHWPGDEADLAAIVKDVYVTRMSGAALTTDQTAALSTWVNAIPAPPAPTWVDASAAAAGRAIFQRADVGCSTCHSGAKFTNNATVDVGTGAAFQVPPLVGVGWRTPLLHDGCAATIADRFHACSTAGHGNLASLSATDITNLTAYLETL